MALATPADQPFVLRVARAEDEAAILGLADELAAFPVPPWRSTREIQRADDAIIRDILAGRVAGAFARVAAATKGLLGVVCVREQEDYFTHEALAYVEVLAVDPAARGRGVARALMEAAEAWARETGFRRIALNVWVQNERARGLYEHLGYVPETMQYLKQL